ncbi:vWA domain-containing protein [Sporosarcina ureilytica]|uniref:VWFA domain-containing protein n=1 Tax=Sporosarcina ureilytica TaxID=298596 RepID=A0A1D8JCN0_9BACL|nr:VWA domain-containing protein [Sporosarcina ureilytica]AOV06464.1 hypothetical protein BI350_01815 [Sporosarcina ureilytica]
MSKNTTELVFILDKSGSMSGLEADTIGGYNAMLQKQKEENGEATITTVLFSDAYELLHDAVPIDQVDIITERDYQVGGMTALLDAIGFSIQKASRKEAENKVLFVITTDGMENASREYEFEKIKTMIERKKADHGWEFIFLGANIDAIATAEKFGIHEDFAVNYHADSEGVQVSYNAINEAVASFRMEEKIDHTWKDAIEKDYNQR